MSKRIIVTERCNRCPYYSVIDGVCRAMNRYCPRDSNIPVWCPLPEMPRRRIDGEVVAYKRGEPMTEELENEMIDFGFNECLDEIKGGGSDG